MESIYFKDIRELKKEQKQIEHKIGLSLQIAGKKVAYEGSALQEYETGLVLNAIAFGFSAKKALQLLEPDMGFKILHMKDFTRRKDMEEVRARVIGKEGKTKRTIENITNCTLVIHDDNEIGIIGLLEDIDHAVVGIGNLIRGTKEANAYAFLERMNAESKKYGSDLGLKEKE